MIRDQKQVVDRLVEILLPANYIPDPEDERFRRALYREFLRYRNEDFSDFLSRIDVTVRGEEGEERERLWQQMVGIYAPYTDYQAATERRIPVVVLEPLNGSH